MQIGKKSIMMDFYGPRGFFCGAPYISSQSDSRCKGGGLSKISFLGVNYSATIWPIRVIFLGKIWHISSYWSKFYV